MKSKAEVFDFNGTLVDNDKPRKHVLKKLKKAEKKGDKAIVISAEPEKYKPEVEEWLTSHDVSVDKLVMRPKADAHEPDAYAKKKMLRDVSKQFDVVKAFDDKKSNVKMFRKQGVKAKEV